MTGSATTWEEASKYANHWQRGVLLLGLADRLSHEDYWRAVREAWSDSDRQPLTKRAWRRLWLADRPGREQSMTTQERDQLAALPERVTVYRGVSNHNHVGGLSWTLDRNLAHWFARRFVDDSWPGSVITGTVLRGRILALIQSRSESEIVAQPKHVYARTWVRADQSYAEEVIDRRRRALAVTSG